MTRVLIEIAQELRKDAFEPKPGGEPVSPEEAIEMTDLANKLTSIDMELHSGTKFTFNDERYYRPIKPTKPQPLP